MRQSSKWVFSTFSIFVAVLWGAQAFAFRVVVPPPPPAATAAFQSYTSAKCVHRSCNNSPQSRANDTMTPQDEAMKFEIYAVNVMDPERLTRLLVQYIKRRPYDVSERRWLARKLIDARNYEAAETELTRLQEICGWNDPNCADILNVLGRLKEYQGQYHEALRYYKSANEIVAWRFHHLNGIDVLTSMGRVYLALDDPQNALYLCRSALEKDHKLRPKGTFDHLNWDMVDWSDNHAIASAEVTACVSKTLFRMGDTAGLDAFLEAELAFNSQVLDDPRRELYIERVIDKIYYDLAEDSAKPASSKALRLFWSNRFAEYAGCIDVSGARFVQFAVELSEQGNEAEARKYFDQALETLRKSKTGFAAEWIQTAEMYSRQLGVSSASKRRRLPPLPPIFSADGFECQ